MSIESHAGKRLGENWKHIAAYWTDEPGSWLSLLSHEETGKIALELRTGPQTDTASTCRARVILAAYRGQNLSADISKLIKRGQ